MKKIILYGFFNSEVVRMFREMLPADFQVVETASPKQYDQLSNADYMVNRTFAVDKEVFNNATKLCFIQKWGSGYDKIDVADAGRRGIPVVTCLGINSNPVAELAVLHMLALYKNILPLNEKLKKGIWARDEYAKRAYLLNGKTVGLIGVGNIGRKVAKILKEGFETAVQYYDPIRMSEKEEISIGLKYTDMDTLLRTSDIISLHVPLINSTRNLINSNNLKKMKSSAIIINTSRGGIIDEEALIEALQNKVIAGAGLDTFSDEPLDVQSPLLKMENVVVTPHCGGNTADNDVNMVKCCVKSILSFEKGEKPRPPYLVNQEFLKWY